jgi:tetratricopeptide (TPR) repeat protein
LVPAEESPYDAGMRCPCGIVLLGFLVATEACHPGGARSFGGASVVLISIDTLRADHLPAYGYRGVETPHIDRLRGDSILFENAYSHCPLTLPSHVSLLTGTLPPEHGVRDNLGYSYDAAAHPGLPALLKAAGYKTGAFVSAYVLRGATGLSSSFDTYDDEVDVPRVVESAALAQRSGRVTEQRAEGFLKTVRPPFFLFFHIYEPHLPYDPPEPFKSRFALPYDGEIATADAIVGDLLDALGRSGLYEGSLVILLSDHGEGLSDHGEADHGILLYREVLRVPLLLKLPGSGRGGETIKRPVGLVDVAPTIAGLLGLKGQFRGTPLLSSGPEVAIYSETYYPRIHLGWSELHSLVDARFHLIDGPQPELYDEKADPGERTSLFAERPDLGASMRKGLVALEGAFRAPTPSDPATLERLRSLGYLGGGAEPAAPGDLPNPRDHIGEIRDIQMGFTLAAAGRNAEALAVFQGILKKNPEVFDVRLREGQVLLTLGRPGEAIDSLKKAVEISPSLAAGVAPSLARANLGLGKLQDAITSAELALKASPEEGHRLLAEIALKKDDLKGAEEEAGWLRGHPATAVDGAIALAEVRIRQARFQEALEVLDQARARPAVFGLDLSRGDVLARLNRLPEAEAAFRAESETFPTNSEAFARLAIVLALEGRSVREVDQVLEHMVAARPGEQTELLAAKTLDSLGNPEAARAWRRRRSHRPGPS